MEDMQDITLERSALDENKLNRETFDIILKKTRILFTIIIIFNQ